MRILIADDHALFRDGLRSLLTAHGLDVVAEARNGLEAVKLAGTLQPDIVLMDIQMPEMSGIDATRLISASHSDIRVVMLTASGDDADVFEAIRCGAAGYLTKDLDGNRFVDLLEGVMRGEPALSPSVARLILSELAHPASKPVTPEPSEPSPLTERERDVLELLMQGVTSNKDLAERLFVSENTVKFHMRNILDKLQLANRAQVIAFATRFSNGGLAN